MKTFPYFCVQASLLLYTSITYATIITGFCLPDSVREVTIRFKTYKNLMVLPVRLNNSTELNLILDTGTRNVVLFGRRFCNLLSPEFSKPVKFSGLGKGPPMLGYISLNNSLSINGVIGSDICMVVVPENNVFTNIPDIDGVIGYEMFLRLEIEINPFDKAIIFRPAQNANPLDGYTKLPLEIKDSRPLLASTIVHNGIKYERDVMIDTGSSTGLILHLDVNKIYEPPKENIGFGFNGSFDGYQTFARIANPIFDQKDIPAIIVATPNKQYASLGMHVLKNYIIILNYSESFICFKKRSSQSIAKLKRKRKSMDTIIRGNNYAVSR